MLPTQLPQQFETDVYCTAVHSMLRPAYIVMLQPQSAELTQITKVKLQWHNKTAIAGLFYTLTHPSLVFYYLWPAPRRYKHQQTQAEAAETLSSQSSNHHSA